MKQIHHDKQFHLKIFEAAFEKFFKTQKKFLLSKELFEKKAIDEEIRKILSYDDTKQKIKFEILQTIFLVYITSGGGKTSQFKGNKLYYEVDDLVKDHNTSFQKFRSFCVAHKREDHLNLWFKYTISQNMDKIIGKILVMNHPNQVPNCLRYRINELIIIPKQLNWRTRFFSENFISLISCKDYRKVALPYVEYKSFIEKYFKVGENGKILDNLVFEILKDLGPNEKQEQEIEEAYSSYLDGYEMVNIEENE